MNERYCGSVSVPHTKATRSFHSEFVLGTAQLGMNYGLVNRAGKPTKQAAVEMLKYAIAHGVTALDTARAYGEAECLMGEALTGNSQSGIHVITKLELSGLGADASDSEVRK